MIQKSLFKEEDEIFIDPDGLKPRKVEEVITDRNIPKDTYMIHPSGGFHLFYGVPNTFPIYQEKIWPFVIKITGSARYANGKIITLDLQGSINYPRLNFKGGSGNKKVGYDIKMHRLVALAFIPNPQNKCFVMHRNDDQTNFLVKNLKWGTASENNKGKLQKRPDTYEDKYKSMLKQGILKG